MTINDQRTAELVARLRRGDFFLSPEPLGSITDKGSFKVNESMAQESSAGDRVLVVEPVLKDLCPEIIEEAAQEEVAATYVDLATTLDDHGAAFRVRRGYNSRRRVPQAPLHGLLLRGAGRALQSRRGCRTRRAGGPSVQLEVAKAYEEVISWLCSELDK